MRMKTLGLILVIIGMIGACIAFISGLVQDTALYNKMGLAGLIVEVIGLAGIYIDKN